MSERIEESQEEDRQDVIVDTTELLLSILVDPTDVIVDNLSDATEYFKSPDEVDPTEQPPYEGSVDGFLENFQETQLCEEDQSQANSLFSASFLSETGCSVPDLEKQDTIPMELVQVSPKDPTTYQPIIHTEGRFDISEKGSEKEQDLRSDWPEYQRKRTFRFRVIIIATLLLAAVCLTLIIK
jgi:hypothetical protein